MQRVPPEPYEEWIGESAGTGYDPEGWEDHTWVLHAMYETDTLPAGLSHDDVDRITRAAGEGLVEESPIDSLLDSAVAIGCDLGKSHSPGPGWRRLPWQVYGARFGVDPLLVAAYPCHRSFPLTSWPANIQPPAEGTLDWEQYERLLQILAAREPAGWNAPCLLLYDSCWNEWEEPACFRGSLGDALAEYGSADRQGGPSNLWPEDRSWFIYTDYDLWATKVSGPRALIHSLRVDSLLEIAQLPEGRPVLPASP